jgi:hypothetical protein
MKAARFVNTRHMDVQPLPDARFRAGLNMKPRLHEIRVHCLRMKNITLSADEDLIEQARSIARSQRRSLNDAFREWLIQFTASAGDAQAFDSLMKSLRHVNTGRHFSRDEMNER